MSPELGTIRVTVRLHSILRHRDGEIVSQLELDLPPASTVRDALLVLRVAEELEPVVALNDEVVNEAALLDDGDHLAIIPAVAGG
jgi:molybdopterin converting factor small subunit